MLVVISLIPFLCYVFEWECDVVVVSSSSLLTAGGGGGGVLLQPLYDVRVTPYFTPPPSSLAE